MNTDDEWGFEVVDDSDYAAFRMGLRKIDEVGLNRIMNHGKHGFIVVSANRSEIRSSNEDNDLTGEYEKWCRDNGLDIFDGSIMDEWLGKRNKTEDKNLVAELKNSKYAYSPVYGGYHGTDDVADSFEPSYIVYCHEKKSKDGYLDFDELYDFALHLAGRYKQDSVYVQRPGEAPVYVDAKGNKVNSRESGHFKFNDYTREFYTTIKRKKRTTKDYPDGNGNHALSTPPQRFTADIQFESMYASRGPSDYSDRMRRRQAGEVFVYD